ncbi:excitatory amino acid transporter, putative [Ixodes scapularis]|uniref:Excitatory amino acid transporter, putative n=1 Tax=Ixodes scapularis TaxID=6945 RepID=B7PB29_IXOSC|nr:excitatory amino acid transporter, putative [Ixodes scapularis]|eukprot:XP_002407640.1 excitatory amino acid transporter, putative [Ixodes scapularis]
MGVEMNGGSSGLMVSFSARMIGLVVCFVALSWHGCQAVRVGVLLRRGHNDVWREYEDAMTNFNNSDVASRLGIDIKTHRATFDDNLFITAQELCKQLNAGVTTVLLPSRGFSDAALYSLFGSTNVPRITTTVQQRCGSKDPPVLQEDVWNETTTWTPSSTSTLPPWFSDGSTTERTPDDEEDPTTLGVTMMPDLAPAVIDLADVWGFKSLVFVYDSDHALVTLQQFMDSGRVRVQQARRVSRSAEAHSMLSSLEKGDQQGRKLVVLDCAYDLAKDIVIRHVRDVYMGRRNYHYVLVKPIVSERYLEGVSEFAALNITAFRFQNTEGITQAYNYNYRTTLIINAYRTLKEDPPPKNADLFEDRVSSGYSGGTSCGRVAYLTKDQGQVVDAYLKNVVFDGKTGRVAFDSEGCRVNFTVDVMQVNGKNQWIQTGTWSKSSGFVRSGERNDSVPPGHKDYVYRVTTILEDPYLMVKNKKYETDGTNQTYEGFCKDLIDAISRLTGIKYQLHLVKDDHYGSVSIDGWNGMIGEIVSNDADIALAGLTITSARKNVVDFTHPFLTSGIAALIKKPSKLQKGVGVNTFLAPFELHLWIGLGASLGAVLLFLFIFGAAVMKNDHCCYQAGDEDVSKDAVLKTVCESLEMVAPLPTGSFMARSISGRIVSSFWWMFVVLVFSTYTTTLTPLLTLRDAEYSSISTLEELSMQNKVKFGTLRTGGVQEYFEESQYRTNKLIWEAMKTERHVLVGTRQEGVGRVRSSDGKYVFFTESLFADYVNGRRPCDTKVIGEVFATQYFGLAVTPGSPLREKLNEAIVNMTESGEIDEMKAKWWASECDAPPPDEPMRLELFLHIIFYLACLLIVGIAVALLELLVRGCNKWRFSRLRAVSARIDRERALRRSRQGDVTGVFPSCPAGVSDR